MNIIIIANTDEFSVTSYGNGWAYRFADKVGLRDVWMQDNDANSFRERWNNMEARWPDKSLNKILGALWYEYECVSQPTELAVNRLDSDLAAVEQAIKED